MLLVVFEKQLRAGKTNTVNAVLSVSLSQPGTLNNVLTDTADVSQMQMKCSLVSEPGVAL